MGAEQKNTNELLVTILETGDQFSDLDSTTCKWILEVLAESAVAFSEDVEMSARKQAASHSNASA